MMRTAYMRAMPCTGATRRPESSSMIQLFFGPIRFFSISTPCASGPPRHGTVSSSAYTVSSTARNSATPGKSCHARPRCTMRAPACGMSFRRQIIFHCSGIASSLKKAHACLSKSGASARTGKERGKSGAKHHCGALRKCTLPPKWCAGRTLDWPAFLYNGGLLLPI